MPRIRIATRESQLALWQANEVARLLQSHHTGLSIEIVGMTTEGDRFLQAPLSAAGGKGLFVKELEQSLLQNATDIAVHSMKDVPFELPPGLGIHAILPREDPRDAFVSKQYNQLEQLPLNAIVGTSSSRRECQLRAYRDDLQIKSLRGNVNTRLAKLDDGQYDAIILASAGLKRLGFSDRISSYIDTTRSLPAIGQGAIGIECRDDDADTRAIIACLHDEQTALCVQSERCISTALSASCHLPIAAHATQAGEHLNLRALVGHPSGAPILQAQQHGEIKEATQVCAHVIQQLTAKGALELVSALRQTTP